MKKFLLLAFVFSSLQLALAQVRTTQIDSVLNAIDSRGLALGSLTISQDGRIIYQKALGYAHLNGDQKIPTTTQTRYRIGSVTKTFTAVMIFQLAEEGKIKLDQKLETFFPDLPNANTITITNLLNHQSGLHDYTNNTGFETWMTKPKSQTELLQIIRDKGADFEPGNRNEYNNTNYLILGYIIEKVTKSSYEVNLQKRIISKIKLKNTYLAKTQVSDLESVSYKYSNAVWNPVPQTDPTIHTGAGAIVSTPGDLVAFIQSLFTGKLIRQSSVDKMKTMTNDYGLGLFNYDYGLHTGYGHNGRIEEFYTAVRYFPDSKIAVVYCTNGINYPRIDLLESVVKSCFNESVTVPFSSYVPGNLDKYSGIYEAAQMPAVTISVQNSKLVAETQGAEFELELVAENYFMHTPAGYYFEFVPSESTLRIKETDNVYFLKKK